MASEWEPVLKDVISEVLETMFFTTVEFEQCGQMDHPFEYISEIDLFSHEGRTVISMLISEEFAATITADFLGIRLDQVKEDDVEDCIKELANMTGGGYHARINDADWQLGIPRAWKIAPGDRDPAKAAAGLGFSCLGQSAGSVFLLHLSV
jgi:CheY-specific phosphatase CheX